MAFEKLIAPNERPSYFIYFQINPDAIDVNIHPTKTEVKFENEQALWQILMVTVKESLGKFNAVPSIDFDTDDAPDIPIFDPARPAPMPRVNVNPDYNPFSSSALGWEQLYEGFESEREREESPGDFQEEKEPTLAFKQEGTNQEPELFPEHYQYKRKYILTSVKSGLMVIDQHKAHVRILFDKYLQQIQNRKGVSQRILFPEVMELSASEAATLPSVSGELEALGFELSELGNRSFAIQGVPSEIEYNNPTELVRGMISKSMETDTDVKAEVQESIALSLANMTAIPYGRGLTSEEMLLIVSQLFASKEPTYTPDGQVIVNVISDKEIEKKMKG